MVRMEHKVSTPQNVDQETISMVKLEMKEKKEEKRKRERKEGKRRSFTRGGGLLCLELLVLFFLFSLPRFSFLSILSLLFGFLVGGEGSGSLRSCKREPNTKRRGNEHNTNDSEEKESTRKDHLPEAAANWARSFAFSSSFLLNLASASSRFFRSSSASLLEGEVAA